MGGAGVASTRGSAAIYWNPAALAFQKDDGRPPFNIGGGFSVVLGAIGSTMSDLDRLAKDVQALDVAAIEAKFNSGTQLTEAELRQAVQIITLDLPALVGPGDGLILDAMAGPSAQWERFGFGVFATIHGGITANFDFSFLAFGNQGITSAIGAGNDRSGQISTDGQSLADQLASTGNVTQNQAEELVFQAEQSGAWSVDPATQDALNRLVNTTAANVGGSAANFFTNNQTGGAVHGIFIQELATGYGHPIIPDFLAVGATFKVMNAITFSSIYSMSQSPESSELASDIYELRNTEDTANVGVDAGALLTPFRWLALGVTGKNLNRPSFDREGGGHTYLDPTARAGVAFYPLPFLSLAADMDLYHYQSDVLPGYRSQILGGGASLDFGWIAVQAGLSKNLIDPEEDTLIHTSLLFQWGYFSLEFAGAVTPNWRAVEFEGGAEVPERAGFAFSFGFNIPW